MCSYNTKVEVHIYVIAVIFCPAVTEIVAVSKLQKCVFSQDGQVAHTCYLKCLDLNSLLFMGKIFYDLK